MEHDHTIVGWKAWYANRNQPYESSNTCWSELPDDGVIAVLAFERQVVVSSRKHYRVLLTGSPNQQGLGDMWFFQFRSEAGEIMYNCSSDPPEVILERYPGALLKRGKMIGFEELRSIEEKAMADYRVPGSCKDCGNR